jgi:hypothetical protein
MSLAPIVLFCHNRLSHLQQTVEALAENDLAPESHLFVVSDGPGVEADIAKVRAIREYSRTIAGFKRTTLVERGPFYGEAESVIAGVTELVSIYGALIVLQDGMVPSPFFLRYMNEALDLYQEEEKVISISGHVYPCDTGLPETFFLRGADSCGWGTWKRGWDLFKIPRGMDWEKESWAGKWREAALAADKLTLYPGRSLVGDAGMTAEPTTGPIKVARIAVEENSEARDCVERYLAANRPSLARQAMGKIKRLWAR